LHTVSTGGMLGLYRLELQIIGGKLSLSGFGSSSGAKEPVKEAFNYFTANLYRVSGGVKPVDHDYHRHVIELHITGNGYDVVHCPLFRDSGKTLQGQMLGDMT
jgi:ATP-dependent Lon protease